MFDDFLKFERRVTNPIQEQEPGICFEVPGAPEGSSSHPLSRILALIIRLTAVLPLLFFAYIVQINEYLELGYFLVTYNRWFNMALLAFSAFWMVSPQKKRFPIGTKWELVYNCFPVITYLTLSFAERKPILTLILLLLFGVYSLFSWGLIFSDKLLEDETSPQHQRMKDIGWTMFSRRFFYAFNLVFLIPALVAMFGFHMRSEQADIQMLCREVYGEVLAELIYSDMPDRDAVYADNAERLEQFTKRSWNSMTNGEKTAAITELCAIECAYLGIEPEDLQVTVGKLEPNEYGHYSSEDQAITVNAAILQSRDAVLSVICHECFHYYQHRMVETIDHAIGWNSSEANAAYFDDLRLWRSNLHCYINEATFEQYQDQPLEMSARDFAEEQMKAIFRCISE